jgi:adenylate kinase family enzyme
MANTRILERQGNARITRADGKKIAAPGGYNGSIIGAVGTSAPVLFLLGRPCSGKSTVGKTLSTYLQGQGREVVLFDDYHFLQAKAEVEKRLGNSIEYTAQFCQTAKGDLSGFKVLDFAVLEQVLCQINRCVCEYLWRPNTVIMVEFARDEYLYEHVWQYFSHEVRMTAHYVFCDADLEICIKRGQKRAQFVAPEIMLDYYCKDGLPSLFQNCCGDRIEVVNTNETMLLTNLQVAHFLDKVFALSAFRAEDAVAQQRMPGYYKEGGLSNLLGNYRKRGAE